MCAASTWAQLSTARHNLEQFCRDGRDVRAHRAQDRRAARRASLIGEEETRATPEPARHFRCSRHCPSASSATSRDATSSAPGRRDRLRRLCGQRRAQDQRGVGALWRRAAPVANANGHCQVGALLSRRAFKNDFRRPGLPRVRGARCWACAARAYLPRLLDDRAIFNGIRVAYEFAKAERSRV